MRFVIPALIVMCAIGCGPSSSGSSGNKGNDEATDKPKTAVKTGDEYWPLKEGNAWTYEIVQQLRGGKVGGDSTRATITFKVRKVTESNGEKIAEVALLDVDLREQAILTFVANDKGLFQRGIRSAKTNVPISPDVPLALVAPDKSKPAQWEGTGPQPYVNKVGKFALSLEYGGTMEVDAMQDRYPCEVFTSKTEIKSGKQVINYRQDSYFAPGIGLVRSVEESQVTDDGRPFGLVTKTTTLRSHTLK